MTSHTQSSARHRRRGRKAAASIAALSVLGTAAVHSSTASAADLPVREVEWVYTGEFGVPRPNGVAYDAVRKSLVVAGPAAGGARAVRLDERREDQGRVDLPVSGKLSSLTYDRSNDTLTVVAGGDRVEYTGRDTTSGRPNPGRRVGLGNAIGEIVSSTFDASGTWYGLDGRSGQVWRQAKGEVTPKRFKTDGNGRIEAIAVNPSDGLLYALRSRGSRVEGLGADGSVKKSYRLNGLGLQAPTAIAFAPSSDHTDDPNVANLFVVDEGGTNASGGVLELSLIQVAAAIPTVENASLVRTIATSAWFPGSPDPSDVVWMPGRDELVSVDSEVDETTGAGWNNVNLWRTSITNAQTGTGALWGPTSPSFNGRQGFSREPTGVGYQASTDTMFVSDDSARRVFIIRAGGDGRFGSTDDIVTSIDTRALGSNDTEDPEFVPSVGHLFVLDGVGTEIYRIDPVDGTFGNGNDVVTQFDISGLGAADFEGLASDPARGTLYVGARSTRQIFEITTDGTLLRTINATGIAGLRFISGLTVAPASNGPGMNLYIADRAIDNGPQPNENDGRIFEISATNIGGEAPNVAPSVNAGADSSVQVNTATTLNGSVFDDGLPTGAPVTQTWTQQSGPGSVSFGSPNAAVTSATFSAAGTYVLRLTATDTALSAFDEVTVNVTAAPSNVAPSVSAGSDTSVAVNTALTLNGSVSDDGLPTGAPVTQTWTQQSGPGTVSFGSANAAVTSATFNTAGVYVLRLTASDTALSAFDEVTVNVTAAPTNVAPTVNAGADSSAAVNTPTTLNGSVSDDGLPTGAPVTQTWTQQSGPGTVSFGSPNAAVTSATFDAAGVYVLRLTATDTALSAFDEVTVTVNPGGGGTTVTATFTIASGADDVEQNVANSRISSTSSDLNFPLDGTIRAAVGMRFTGVSIPQGATITSAAIQFRSDEVGSLPVTLTIRGELTGNAAVFTTVNNNLLGRTFTSGSALWTPPAWPAINQATSAQLTSNFANVIQEIINQGTWAAGNALVILVRSDDAGSRVGDSFEGGFAPRLIVTYTTPA